MPPAAVAAELSKYPHLNGLQLAEQSEGGSTSQVVDVLIGLDHFQEVIDGKMRIGLTGPVGYGLPLRVDPRWTSTVGKREHRPRHVQV